MADPRPTGPHASGALVAKAYLIHLQETKDARETKVQECERILSIFRSHVAHKEKKIGGEVPAKQAIHEVVDLTGDDEEDIADAETSGDESESESEDDSPYPQRINGNNHYRPGAFEDSDSEEESEGERRKEKSWRAGLRRIQRGTATPCTDDSHPDWCVHAKDLRYHNHYAWLEDSEVEDEDESDGDAMSVESDSQPASNEAGNAVLEDGKDETMHEPTPLTNDESAGSSAEDNQSASLIDLAISNQEDDIPKASSDTDLASNNEQNDVPEAPSSSKNTVSEEAAKNADTEELAGARSQMTALKIKLVILKDCRDKLNAVLDPKIAEVTGKLSSPEGCEELRELGFSDALDVFREAAQGVDRLCKEILEAEKAALNIDGFKEARESSEETEEYEDDANVDFGNEEGSVNEGEEAAGEEGDVEPLEESEQHTSTGQGAAVFNIPVIGGKRNREEDEEDRETAAKRARLEDLT